jgi:3-dehydroquinate synthase
VARHRAILSAIGLPTTYRGDRWSDLLTAMRRDKKSRGSTLRFVVLDGLAAPTRLVGPDDETLRSAYGLVAASSAASVLDSRA